MYIAWHLSGNNKIDPPEKAIDSTKPQVSVKQSPDSRAQVAGATLNKPSSGAVNLAQIEVQTLLNQVQTHVNQCAEAFDEGKPTE